MALAQHSRRDRNYYDTRSMIPRPTYSKSYPNPNPNPNQDLNQIRVQRVPARRDWWSEVNKLIFTLETTRSQFFTTLCVQVFANRVTLTYKPFIGAGETVQTYNAGDIGNVYVNKSRKAASIGVSMKNQRQILFEIKRLKHSEAERLKDALEKMIAFNHLTFRR